MFYSAAGGHRVRFPGESTRWAVDQMGGRAGRGYVPVRVKSRPGVAYALVSPREEQVYRAVKEHRKLVRKYWGEARGRKTDVRLVQTVIKAGQHGAPQVIITTTLIAVEPLIALAAASRDPETNMCSCKKVEWWGTRRLTYKIVHRIRRVHHSRKGPGSVINYGTEMAHPLFTLD